VGRRALLQVDGAWRGAPDCVGRDACAGGGCLLLLLLLLLLAGAGLGEVGAAKAGRRCALHLLLPLLLLLLLLVLLLLRLRGACRPGPCSRRRQQSVLSWRQARMRLICRAVMALGQWH
jgi:hypothetical protein